jgi:hypothetical protein
VLLPDFLGAKAAKGVAITALELRELDLVAVAVAQELRLVVVQVALVEAVLF